MKKILLTSTGLQYKAVADKFLEMILQKPGDLRILFIPTASRYKEELMMVNKSLLELLSVGVNKNNIFWFDPDVPVTHRDNSEFDCIYVCGGNTYYLVKKLKECGLFQKIQNWVSAGTFYIGASAGSVIASPDIDYICCMDTNDCNLSDTTGLSLIAEDLIPHYTNEFADVVAELQEKNKKPLAISDCQAVAINDNSLELIG